MTARSWRSATRNQLAVMTRISQLDARLSGTPGCADSLSGGDALRRLHHRGERAMPLRHAELDPAGALYPRTAYLGAMVLEPFRHHNLDTVRSARYRIADRLVLGFDHPRDRYFGPSARQIELEPDRRKDRIEHFRHDQAEDLENSAFG